jgi:serine/threonine-protein kinase
VFPRHTLLGSIGAGGMAELFLAERAGAEGARRRVVLKRILPAFARDPDFRELFAHEARIVMQLSHANIVQVYDFEDIGDTYVLEMEYVEGCDLKTLLRERGSLPLAAALRVAVEILRGLDYAHRRSGADGMPLEIVHRDVSPGNILLSREGEVKLTDFGLARSRERWRRSVGGVKGTFEFMAPEQAEGRPADARADVFAAGAILYTMLVGESPFEAEGPVATLDLVREGKYVPLREACPTAPDEICAVVARALAKNADDRFVSAAAMGEAIESFAHAQGLRLSAESLAPLVCEVAVALVPVVTTPVAAPPRVVAAADSDPPPLAVAHTRAMAPRRTRRAPLIMVSVLALGAIGVAAFALRPKSQPAPVVVAVTPPAPPPQEPPPTPTVAPDPVPSVPASIKPAAKPKPALLTISADPWAFVSIDGKKRGTTPLHDVALPAGPHEVTFENPPLGVSRSQLVRLHAGEHKTIIERLAK